MSKYYAVKQGRKTGIFKSWDECKDQVHKFSGAKYKSFHTREEAENYLNSDTKSNNSNNNQNINNNNNSNQEPKQEKKKEEKKVEKKEEKKEEKKVKPKREEDSDEVEIIREFSPPIQKSPQKKRRIELPLETEVFPVSTHSSGLSAKFEWQHGAYFDGIMCDRADYKVTFYHGNSKVTVSIYLMIKNLLPNFNRTNLSSKIRNKIENNVNNLFDMNLERKIIFKLNGRLTVDFVELRLWLAFILAN